MCGHESGPLPVLINTSTSQKHSASYHQLLRPHPCQQAITSCYVQHTHVPHTLYRAFGSEAVVVAVWVKSENSRYCAFIVCLCRCYVIMSLSNQGRNTGRNATLWNHPYVTRVIHRRIENSSVWLPSQLLLSSSFYCKR